MSVSKSFSEPSSGPTGIVIGVGDRGANAYVPLLLEHPELGSIVGVAERALEMMCERLLEREAFGKKVGEHSVWEERIADARIDIECARLLTLKAAHLMDTVGNKVARAEIAMIKVKAPIMALKIIDDAIQAHGGGGVSSDFGLAESYAGIRSLRLADGPDEVHLRAIARNELKKYRDNPDYPTHDPESGIPDC